MSGIFLPRDELLAGTAESAARRSGNWTPLLGWAWTWARALGAAAVAAVRRARLRAETRRELRQLDERILRDIGYPEIDPYTLADVLSRAHFRGPPHL